MDAVPMNVVFFYGKAPKVTKKCPMTRYRTVDDHEKFMVNILHSAFLPLDGKARQEDIIVDSIGCIRYGAELSEVMDSRRYWTQGIASNFRFFLESDQIIYLGPSPKMGYVQDKMKKWSDDGLARMLVGALRPDGENSLINVVKSHLGRYYVSVCQPVNIAKNLISPLVSTDRTGSFEDSMGFYRFFQKSISVMFSMKVYDASNPKWENIADSPSYCGDLNDTKFFRETGLLAKGFKGL